MSTLLASARLYYTHWGITFLLWGIVFVLLGVLVGWLAWRHCREEAARIEAANGRLRAEQDKARVDLDALEAQIADLEAANA